MKSRTLMGIGAALLVGACSGISTSTDYDPQVDFTAFSTYDWVDSQGDVDNITSSRIRQSVDAALAAKGFSQSASEPDVAVSYQVSSAERRSFNTVNAGWGGGYGWGGWGMGMGTSTTTENVWQEGSLILGIFDTGTKNLVWTGTATTDIDPSRSPADRQKVIDDAVGKLMADFPPGG
ncbi:MAG: DUF4136 domain-containing protein [Gemmatimonadetes bacterium]|nr:DUF4136 domain-containing protein [Gemmatimonadota bacterium]MBT8478168.1 DUF4136 domain-containing protein [Gemmatimonadota bacterium]NNK48830.1 DUF4136 domain-containing protein [Gemmatimonadota bacterium]